MKGIIKLTIAAAVAIATVGGAAPKSSLERPRAADGGYAACCAFG